MKGKRGSGYAAILILLVVILVQQAYAITLSECNLAGGIWCGNENGGNCFGDSATAADVTQPDKTCNVKVSQNVTLDKDWKRGLNANNMKTYTLMSLKIDSNAKLQFYNTLYTTASAPKAADATCASTLVSQGGGGFLGLGNCDNYYPTGGSPLSNTNTISTGGKGGNGGFNYRANACNRWGGGGGAGAGGGKLGASGGDGRISLTKYSGGSGAGSGSNCGGTGSLGIGGFDGGRGGGFVKINADTIIIDSGSVLSVDGENGQRGYKNADGGKTKSGYGGGPGSGGGGAGKIVLSYKSLSGSGTISANGGTGGDGGSGSTGNQADGAPAGGGGGGQGGIIGLATLPGGAGNSLSLNNVVCSKGLGGKAGALATGGDGDATVASNGADGIDGLCKTTEMDPGNTGTPAYSNCNDGKDNDNNGQIDMDDMNCRNAGKWDASIYTAYTPLPANFAPSAKTIADLACGDDTGICINVPSNAGICKDKDRSNLCQTKYCKIFNEVDYACGCEITSELEFRICLATEEEYTGIYNPYTRTTEYHYTSQCMVNNNIQCSYFNSESSCTEFADLCEWSILPPAVTCSDFWGEQDCKAQANNGCAWTYLQAGTGDLGFMTADNKYLCLNSLDQSGALFLPGNNYAWISAEGVVVNKPEIEVSPYLIFQADDTQFISNGATWFQCSANSTGPSYTASAANKIAEYSTFAGNPATEAITCDAKLEKGLMTNPDREFNKINQCDDLSGKCEKACDDDEECAGWCPKYEFTPGYFLEDCGEKCELKNADDGYDFLIDSFSDIKADFCKANKFEPVCKYTLPDEGKPSANYMPQQFCKDYPAICIGDLTPSDETCEKIHQDLGYIYINDTVKMCTSTQYCANGKYLQTSDSTEEASCCFGQAAYCEDFNAASCADSGGETRPESCPSCVCTTIEKDGCCIGGKYIDSAQLGVGVNDSFICFEESGRSLIQECCGLNGCKNQNNELNANSFISKNVYSMDGVPLHSLMSFDRTALDSNGEKLPTRFVRTFYDRMSGKSIILTSSSDFFNYANIESTTNTVTPVDWKTFNYLDFDILYNNPSIDYVFVFRDDAGVDCSFNAKDYITIKKGPQRWQHVTLPLNLLVSTAQNLAVSPDGSPICTSAGFNTKAVEEIEIKLINSADENQTIYGINLALDNFFLRSDGAGQNSENRFCSGNWGDWVKNLDGPNAEDESGFFSADFTADDRANLSLYGPFRDACEGVVSFGWTGSACCGDDTTTGGYGEFWSESGGVCWNGTTVYDDMTVADALGLNPVIDGWEESANERALLFYGGNLISCNRNLENYTYNIAYDGSIKEEEYLEVSERVEPYTIRGSWMCEQDKGWIKLDDVNRARLLAANLKAIAAVENKDYTLVCGDYSNLTNVFGTGTDKEIPLTDYICVLRMGDNKKLGNDDRVVMGIEINRQAPFDQYRNVLVNEFPVIAINDEDTTCAELSSKSADSDKFFTKCAIDSNGNGFRVYYNAPLNMIILSDKEIYSTNIENRASGFLALFRNMWDGIRIFFGKLFGAYNNIPELNKLEKDWPADPADPDLAAKDFYISVQGDRTIMGVMEKAHGEFTSLRVDYLNLSTNVKILADAVKANYPDAEVTYNASNYTQSVYVNVNVNDDVNWRFITSVLRLSPEGTSVKFE